VELFQQYHKVQFLKTTHLLGDHAVSLNDPSFTGVFQETIEFNGISPIPEL